MTACDGTEYLASNHSRARLNLAVFCLVLFAGMLQGVVGDRSPDPDSPQVYTIPDGELSRNVLDYPEQVHAWTSKPNPHEMTGLHEYRKAASGIHEFQALGDSAAWEDDRDLSASAQIRKVVPGNQFFWAPTDGKFHTAADQKLDEAFTVPREGVELEQDPTERRKFHQREGIDTAYAPLAAGRGGIDAGSRDHGEYEKGFGDHGVLKPSQKGSPIDKQGRNFSWFNPTISREIPIRDAIENIRLAARYARWVTQANLNALSNQDNVTSDLKAKFQELAKGADKYVKDVWNELDLEDSLRMNQLRSARPQGEWDPDAGFTRVKGRDSARGTIWNTTS